MLKSSTDLFWDNRPNSCSDKRKVNIDDLAQRKLECAFIEKFLGPDLDVLEVGCGNGFLSSWLADQVKHLDAFDYSPNMVSQAQELHKKNNILYFENNIVSPSNVDKKYDRVVCVRVLINLQDFEAQKKAIDHLHSFLKQDGKLILIEGFLEGFSKLNQLRGEVDLPSFSPAAINYYSSVHDFGEHLTQVFEIEEEFHTGMFDFLTRIVNPLLNGVEKASQPSEFHDKVLPLCHKINPDSLKGFARERGWALKKKH